MNVYDTYESNVRSYCRKFTDTFTTAKGSRMFTDRGKIFIDFFAGAGALNYGHNNPAVMKPVMEYVASGGIIHSLDMHTAAKAAFIEVFETKILKPRGLNYKIQFCGPTGTNGVESALKLARKVKKRPEVFAFTGAYHGMTAGSLAATSGTSSRLSAGTVLPNVTFFPYPDQTYGHIDGIAYMEALLTDDHSGVEKPAAVIFESVQAEGGINVAPVEWMKRLCDLCHRHDILLICDDVQVGCYRTGNFFSFERAGIVPDMVILSKSISGCGFPMALVLMRPELDLWAPGEHSGTFRGYQPAMVGATAAIGFAEQNDVSGMVKEKSHIIEEYLQKEIASLDSRISIRGIGFVWGIDFSGLGTDGLAGKIAGECYKNGLVIETAGRGDSVLKLLPALTIEEDLLKEGLSIIKQSTLSCLEK